MKRFMKLCARGEGAAVSQLAHGLAAATAMRRAMDPG